MDAGNSLGMFFSIKMAVIPFGSLWQSEAQQRKSNLMLTSAKFKSFQKQAKRKILMQYFWLNGLKNLFDQKVKRVQHYS